MAQWSRRQAPARLDVFTLRIFAIFVIAICGKDMQVNAPLIYGAIAPCFTSCNLYLFLSCLENTFFITIELG